MVTSNATEKFYSRQGLWFLFLMCALPLHIWTFILAFRDFSWVTERTNSWDAIGVISYGLIFTFFEGVAIFVTAALLGMLISRKWGEGKRIAITSVGTIILSLWAMANHLYFLNNNSLPAFVFLIRLDHPLRFLYAFFFLIVTTSFLLPIYSIIKSEIFFQIIQTVNERLSILMNIYLIADVIALIIILIRNIRG